MQVLYFWKTAGKSHQYAYLVAHCMATWSAWRINYYKVMAVMLVVWSQVSRWRRKHPRQRARGRGHPTTQVHQTETLGCHRVREWMPRLWLQRGPSVPRRERCQPRLHRLRWTVLPLEALLWGLQAFICAWGLSSRTQVLHHRGENVQLRHYIHAKLWATTTQTKPLQLLRWLRQLSRFSRVW